MYITPINAPNVPFPSSLKKTHWFVTEIKTPVFLIHLDDLFSRDLSQSVPHTHRPVQSRPVQSSHCTLNRSSCHPINPRPLHSNSATPDNHKQKISLLLFRLKPSETSPYSGVLLMLFLLLLLLSATTCVHSIYNYCYVPLVPHIHQPKHNKSVPQQKHKSHMTTATTRNVLHVHKSPVDRFMLLNNWCCTIIIIIMVTIRPYIPPHSSQSFTCPYLAFALPDSRLTQRKSRDRQQCTMTIFLKKSLQ